MSEDNKGGTAKRKQGGKVARRDPEFAKLCQDKRLELGATLEGFWGALGVAKSTGSRYESGDRGIPEPIKKIFYITYANKKPEDDPLEKLGDEGKKLLGLLDDPSIAEALLKRLTTKLSQGKARKPRAPKGDSGAVDSESDSPDE